MRAILTPFRFVAMLLTVVGFILTMSVVFLFTREHWARVRWSNRILTAYCRFSLRLLNTKVTYHGIDPESVGTALFVANHHSYMDILAIHARVPVCFVTSREMRETPGLGEVCALAGCLFVERRKLASLRGEVTQIVEGLERGYNVAVFPEATSGNGDALKTFKRPLFSAAERAKKPVVPACLNYHTVGNQPINRITRDKIYWYGDMSFAPHLWALSGSGGIKVEVTFLDPIHPQENQDASDLAKLSQKAIEQIFRPIPTEQNS